MPRDGSGIYSRPPGTDGAPDTTIESAKYNAFVADIEQDANTARPIIAGGTGANSARDARIAMGAETAMQTVTNYDSHVWENGSFWSAAGATMAPVAGRTFGGSAVIVNNDPQYIIVRAHDITDTVVPGRNYIREKKVGVWGPWKSDGTSSIGDAEGIASETGDMFFGVEGTAPASAFIVNTESDNSGVDLLRANKSGIVQFNAPVNVSTVLELYASTAAFGSGFTCYSHTNKARWSLYLSTGGTESGANAGSDFAIYRYSDDGTLLGRVLNIGRALGTVTVDNKLDVGGDIGVVGNIRTNNSVTVGLATPIGGTVYFGNSGSQYITNNGVDFVHNGGNFISNGSLKIAGEITIGPGSTQGVLRFSSDTNKFLWYNGTQYILNGGDLSVGNRLVVGTDIHTMSSVAFGAVGTNKYMQFSTGALNIYNMTVAPNAGLTMTGGQILPMAVTVGVSLGAGNAGLEVRSTGGADAWFSFHRTGAFAANLGISSDHNLWWGGWSFGNAAYKVLTTREVGSVVSSYRTIYAGDFEHVYQNGLQEPYGATAAVSGCQQGNGIATFRYRYHQMLQNGAWANIEAS
jgi:hypothetical protein